MSAALVWGCGEDGDPTGHAETGGAAGMASGGSGSGGVAGGSGGDLTSGGSGGQGDAGGGQGDAGSAGAGGTDGEDFDPAKRVTARAVNRSGQPVAGIRIDIDGQTGTTAEDGSLVFDDVPDVYDAWIVSANETHVSIWQGVTRRDPVFNVGSSASLSVTIEGAVTHPDLPDGATLQVGLLCDDGNRVHPVTPTDGAYELAMPWPVEAERSCQLLGLAMDGYTPVAAAVKELTLDGSSQLTGQDLELSASSLRTVTLSAQNLSGSSPAPEQTMLADATWGPFWIVPRQDGPASYTLFVPDLVTAVTTSVAGVDMGTGAVVEEFLSEEATSLVIDFAKAPTLIEPAAGATATSDSVFTWSAPGTVGAHTWTLHLGELHVFLYGRSSSIAFPDLAAAGISVPSETAGSWQVSSASTPASIDELLELGTRPWPDKRYATGERPLVFE